MKTGSPAVEMVRTEIVDMAPAVAVVAVVDVAATEDDDAGDRGDRCYCR